MKEAEEEEEEGGEEKDEEEGERSASLWVETATRVRLDYYREEEEDEM